MIVLQCSLGGMVLIVGPIIYGGSELSAGNIVGDFAVQGTAATLKEAPYHRFRVQRYGQHAKSRQVQFFNNNLFAPWRLL